MTVTVVVNDGSRVQDLDEKTPTPHEDDGLVHYQEGKAAGRVVVVGRSTCTFCVKVQTVLAELLADDALIVLNCDKLADGAAVRKAAREDSGGHKSVPMVFIGNRFLGGCDTVSQSVTVGSWQQ